MKKHLLKLYGSIFLLNLIFIFFARDQFSPGQEKVIEKIGEPMEMKMETTSVIPLETASRKLVAKQDTYKIKKLDYKIVEVHNIKDLEKKEEGYFVYSNKGIDLSKLSGNARKEAFVKLLLPSIEVVHKEIDLDKENIAVLSKKSAYTPEEKAYLEDLFAKYKVKFGNWKELDDRLIKYPASLILTQGAIESAWGTSRFFKEGNNIFGMWAMSKKEPRIRSHEKRTDFTVYLRAYPDLKESVEDLVGVLSRVNVYSGLRKAVNEDKSPQYIANYLIKYSEQGREYVNKVQTVLRHNDFQRYDGE
ncbi:glucosaminidase domain-containing protein [Cetobacterium sp. SF1]|uniref:glucosaminidase domain-containing protein n=1 Tax=unclassified Cetobacterium TaxID=2630983 RepID=UPI003CEAF331